MDILIITSKKSIIMVEMYTYTGGVCLFLERIIIQGMHGVMLSFYLLGGYLSVSAYICDENNTSLITHIIVCLFIRGNMK